MKNTLFALSIAALGTLIGYGLYPVINSPTSFDVNRNNALITELESSDTVDDKLESNSTGKGTSLADAVLLTDKTVIQSSSEEDELLIEKDPQLETELDALENHGRIMEHKNNEYVSEGDEYDNENDRAIYDLKTWSMKHKQKVEWVINENVPERSAKGIIDYISTDNPFLTDPILKQGVDTDREWALKMEQTIYDIIASQPQQQDFELLGLTCKQLTCEIIAIEHVRDAWGRVYVELFVNIRSIQPQVPSSQHTNISYIESDNTGYTYVQVDFNPS